MRLDDEIFVKTYVTCRFIVMAKSVLIDDIPDDGFKDFVFFFVLSDDTSGAGCTADDSPAVFDKDFCIIRQSQFLCMEHRQIGHDHSCSVQSEFIGFRHVRDFLHVFAIKSCFDRCPEFRK